MLSGHPCNFEVTFRLVCETFLLHYYSISFCKYHVVSLAGTLTYQKSDLDQLPFSKCFIWRNSDGLFYSMNILFTLIQSITLHLHNVYNFWPCLTKLACVSYTFTGQLCTANTSYSSFYDIPYGFWTITFFFLWFAWADNILVAVVFHGESTLLHIPLLLFLAHILTQFLVFILCFNVLQGAAILVYIFKSINTFEST
jgi:hypothetical protein